MGILKLKRGNSANFGAQTLEAGEPAFLLDSGKLYIGDGTNKVLINPDLAENATTASRLATPRKIGITGDVTGAGVDFDGSTAININTSLPNVGTAGTHIKVVTDSKGRVTGSSGLLVADIPTLTLAKISDSGTVANKNTGTTAGTIPILGVGGKLDASILPALAITETFVVATQAEMTALSAQEGDLAVRTDINKTFILRQEPATTVGNWQELLTPTDAVQSVNGKTGTVTLNAGDVGLGSVTNETKATMFSSPAFTGTPTAPTAPVTTNTTQIATTKFVKDQKYAPLASPTFSGAPKSVTPTVASNDTSIATTAFVKAQGYLDNNSVIDCGTF